MWLETGGGEIVVHQAGGAVHAATGGGNIRIDRAAGAVLARTAGGLIQVQQAGGTVTAETSGGAIQVNSAKGVRCESAGGAIRLRNVSGAVHAMANSGSILAQLVADQPMENSLLSTNAGDITVFIPSNLALTIQATNETGGAGRIVSDFAQIRPQAAQQAGWAPVVARARSTEADPCCASTPWAAQFICAARNRIRSDGMKANFIWNIGRRRGAARHGGGRARPGCCFPGLARRRCASSTLSRPSRGART